MATQATAIAEAERLLRHARKAYDDGHANISEMERRGGQLLEVALATCPWLDWIQRADYSYFVGRTLLSQGVHLYGRFCSHQTVEAYLKAFLRHANVEVQKEHRLRKLLAKAQGADTNQSNFIHSRDAETICLIFEPFYEMARYPVQKDRPKAGKYVWITGMDEKFLDYFVYRMRQLLKVPSGNWDILSDKGHYHLDLVREFHPQFYELFIQNNLNFHE